jgi:integrase
LTVRKKVSGRTRAEIVEKLRGLRQQVDTGVITDDKITVQGFLDRWLTVNLPGSVAEATEDSYVDTMRLHLIPALGRKQLAKLTVADLDKLWRAKRDAGYSTNSVRIMRTVLRRALGQAEREGIVTRNAARLSTPQRIRARPGRALTVEQARQLLDAAAGYRFGAAVVLALTYGLRRGEVLGLHWLALDWQAGLLAVTHSVRRIKDRDTSSGHRTRLVVGELKTPKSRRTLALTILPAPPVRIRRWEACRPTVRAAPHPRPAPCPAADRPAAPHRPAAGRLTSRHHVCGAPLKCRSLRVLPGAATPAAHR